MSKISDNSNVVSTSTTSKPLEATDRRKTLKKLGIGGALVSGAKWTSPVVMSVALPAHAQTSPTTTTTTLPGTTTTTLPGTTTTTLPGTTTTTTTLDSTGDAAVCLANTTGCESRGIISCGDTLDLLPLLNPNTGNNSIVITLTGMTPNSPITATSLDNESVTPGSSDTMTDGAGAATVVYSTGSGNGVNHKATITIDGCVLCFTWIT